MRFRTFSSIIEGHRKSHIHSHITGGILAENFSVLGEGQTYIKEHKRKARKVENLHRAWKCRKA